MREQLAAYDVVVPRWGPEENEVFYAKRTPKYVFGTGRGSALVHRVIRVEIRWWEHTYHGNVRRQSPKLTAVCGCGAFFRISSTKARTCEIPKPDAVLCKACDGHGRNFPRGKEHEVPKPLAKVRLGCIEAAL